MYYEGPKNKGTNKVLIALMLIIVAVGSFFGGSVFGSLNKQVVLNPETPQATPQDDAFFDKLYEVKDILNSEYYLDIDQNALLEGAIKGMVNAVGDPYSVFFNGEEYQSFNDDGNGNYVGIGVMVGIKEDKIVVITPFEGSPAYNVGIRTGDFITKVEGVPYTGQELDKAVSIIKGNEGEPVTLTIMTEGIERDVTIVRASITIDNVESEMLEGNIGHVTLLQFSADTAKQVKVEMDTLKAQGAVGYVLDLRGNPGGFLDEAVELGSLFTKKGDTLLYTLDKYDQKTVYPSLGGEYIGIPLVVMIDGGSASASEVVAGALKDYGAATLVGQKSFGKGIVQMIYDVGEGEGLKVTVSSYYSPNGVNIHGTGIVPDIEIALPEDIQAPLTLDNDTQLQKAVEALKGKIK